MFLSVNIRARQTTLSSPRGWEHYNLITSVAPRTVGVKLMYGNKLSKIGRKSVPEFRPRKVYRGFPGVCSYLLDIICILVSELMTVYIQPIVT